MKTKLWITKYALTRGLFQAEGKAIDAGKYFSCHNVGFFRVGTETSEDREAAVVKANQMVTLKISSLEKQIAKLRKLKF